MLERTCACVPTIIVTVADNQIEIAKHYDSTGKINGSRSKKKTKVERGKYTKERRIPKNVPPCGCKIYFPWERGNNIIQKTN